MTLDFFVELSTSLHLAVDRQDLVHAEQSKMRRDSALRHTTHRAGISGKLTQAKAGDHTVGTIVCKAERELEDDPLTGYIAMLAVDTTFRKHGIGEHL